MTARVEHLNPEDCTPDPAFTNAVTVAGLAQTVCVGGQNVLTASGIAILLIADEAPLRCPAGGGKRSLKRQTGSPRLPGRDGDGFHR